MESIAASRGGSSSRSSTSSLSRGSRGVPRPRSPPSMYVSWAVPPPKQPKPLPKLDKKKNKSAPSLQSQNSSTTGRSLFPSFSRRKGPSPAEPISKGKAKATSPVEDMTARPPLVVDSSSDSSMTPSSSRSGYDSSVTSATSIGSFAPSLPASPSIDHITTPPQSSSDVVTPNNLSTSSGTESSSPRKKSTTTLTLASSHHDGDSVEASSPFGLTFPRRLKQRTSAEELNHRRSRSVLVKRRSSMLLSSSVSPASPVISEYQSPSERIGKPISASHNDTPPHATWYRSSSRSGFRSDERYLNQASPDATAGSSRGHNRATSADIGEPFIVIHSSTNVSHGSVSEASKESLLLEANEAPMTFAGQASTSPTVSRTRAASGSRSEQSHSRETSTREKPATPRSVSASQSMGTGPTPQPVSEVPSQDDHHAGHRTGHGGSISVRPGSPFDGLIPPITSIIHKKQDPTRRQLAPTLTHPAGTIRRHAEHGWQGEWNRSNMDDVIQSLRTLK